MTMFVSIDMDNLVFLHKHHEHETVSALSFLEAADRSIRVDTCDRQRFLHGVSDLDLRMLYKNTTGATLAPADTATLRHQLADAVSLMAATPAQCAEVTMQVEAVEARLYEGECFKYARGAKVPAQPVELFPLKARPLSEKELAEAQQRARVAITTYKPRLSGEPRKPWEPELPVHAPIAQPAPTPQETAPEPDRVTSVVRTAKPSVRPIVRSAADAAWEAAGKPTDAASLKELCKGIIPALEAQGYHPTTIRIKLSEWTKEHVK